MGRYLVAMLVMLFSASIGFCNPPSGVDAPADFGVFLRAFGEPLHHMAEELSTRLRLPLPPQAETFFRVAASGTWTSPSREHAGGNGEVMDTLLCTLMLGVYYRHLPFVQ